MGEKYAVLPIIKGFYIFVKIIKNNEYTGNGD
jgi:hypothetical protein